MAYTTNAEPGAGYVMTGSTITYGITPSTEPIAVVSVERRLRFTVTLENSPYSPIEVREDKEGVRWVVIGCEERTLERWNERGERFVKVHHKDATDKERARLLKGLNVALAAITKAFADSE